VQPWSARLGPDESLYVVNRCDGTSRASRADQLAIPKRLRSLGFIFYFLIPPRKTALIDSNNSSS
jgi:hypothetical protein